MPQTEAGRSRLIPEYVAARPVPPLPPAPAYLVWTADSSHAPVTAWIDSVGRPIARRRGVWVTHGARLWRWSQGQRTVVGLDCDCYHRRNSVRACPIRRSLEKAELVQVGGARRLPIVRVGDDKTYEGVDPGMQHPYPTAGAGPYLFNEWTFEGDGCGAHGWWGTVRQLADVRRDALVPTDTVRYTVADSAAGMDKMIATDWGDPEGVGGMNLDDVEAEFLSDSALSVSLRFRTDAPFAMGDGTYGGRTETVPAHHPPRWLAPYVSTPHAVRRFWRTSPRREHAGWSAVDGEHAAALLARFRAR